VKGDSLKDLLQDKLSSKLGCDPTNEICAVTPVEFTSNVAQSFAPCCQASFPCSAEGSSFTRVLGTWKINETSQNFEEQCIVQGNIDDPCSCQKVIELGPQNISFSLCQKEQYCCPTCSCRGDPHCKSFDHKFDNWIVCDNRDSNCKFKRTNDGSCSKVTYQGKPCVFRRDASGKSYCQYDNSPAANLKAPSMIMYEKKYQKNGETRDFSVELRLAVYGSIGSIIVKDGQETMPFVLTYKPVTCTFPAELIDSGKLTRSIVGKVEHYVLQNLDSGVKIKFRCAKGLSELGSRYDVEELTDPEFDPFNPDPSAKGFCVTSKISELLPEEAVSKCSNFDSIILETSFFKGVCSRGQFQKCKETWCGMAPFDRPNGAQLNFQILGFQTQAQCTNYVNHPQNDGKNFARALCASSFNVRLSNPANCEKDENCRECLNDVSDFPDDLGDNLIPPKDLITPAPTTSQRCPTDEQLTQQGLNNPELVFGGIQIEYKQRATDPFVTIFGLSDESIIHWNACNSQCGAPFGNNPVFLKPGFYRMVQKIVPPSDKCAGALGYTATIDFVEQQPPAQILSKPFGPLFSQGSLVCKNTKKVCPENHNCCIWEFKSVQWFECLKSFGDFPNCVPE